MSDFSREVEERLAAAGANANLKESAAEFMRASIAAQYSYNFSWLGRPVIQYPQDMVAVQELIWKVKPDLVIETGIAHGGSLVLSASLLALLDLCEATERGEVLDPRKPRRRVLGLDIDIRAHNRAAIEAHPMAPRIEMIQGSSIEAGIVERVRAAAGASERVLVMLDSNHTHEHVLAELEAYAPLVSPDSYCCVFDGVVEDLPAELVVDRPWGKGDNPKTALHAYLARLQEHPQMGADGTPLHFEIDQAVDHKLMISVAPDGYLRRVPA